MADDQGAAETQALSVPVGRFPYHPGFKERFGIEKGSWLALTNAVFPSAKTLDSILMALSYCKARNLDVFKRPVHIVPMWSTELGCMVDTVWPGIGELRTTASRTHEYAGRDKTEFGPSIKAKYGDVEIEHPEWAECTVYRLIGGQRCAFHGPRVYWRETYATDKFKSDTPNTMWRERPFGQLEKCAEAGALRLAFPEEIGSEYAAEEMEGKVFHGSIEGKATPRLAQSDAPAITAHATEPAGFIRGAEAKALIAEFEEEMAGARTLQELQVVFDDAMKYKGRISNNKIFALEHMRDSHETRIEKSLQRAAEQGEDDIVLATLDRPPTFEELKRSLQEAATDQQLAAWVAKLTPDVLATLPESERNELRAAYKARQAERAAMVSALPAEDCSATLTNAAGQPSEIASVNPTPGATAAEADKGSPAPASAAHTMPPEPQATDSEKAREHQFAAFKRNVANALNRTRLMEVQTLFYKSEWYVMATEEEQEEAKQLVMEKLRALKNAA